MSINLLFNLANTAYQNRERIAGVLEWITSDGSRKLTPEQKIANLIEAFEEIAAIQQEQEQTIAGLSAVIIRLWIAVGIAIVTSVAAIILLVHPQFLGHR